jgi:peptidyl-prolyl cis-trans isomerase SurA
MKRSLLLFAFLCTIATGFSQVLFSYGSNNVDKSEFLRAYNKNKTPVTDKEKALREYLDLYIKFKLKVNAALELKLDTMPQLQYDLQSFRTQIEESYLNNDAAFNDLLNDALHFFFPIDATMKAQDSLDAAKSISAMQAALASGRTDYEKLVSAHTTARHADLGFITAFTLPYDYENLIYNLRVGQVSKPFLAKNGWHVFKLIEERKAIGKWKIAQILMSLPPDNNPVTIKQLEKKADSVYLLLQKGGDFRKLASQFSDDKITYMNGGEIPEFGAGKFDLAFEKEVLKLSRDGEISKPFLSPYGFHIIKRLSQTPISNDRNDNSFLFDIRQKVQQDARINTAKQAFVKEILKQTGFRKTGAVPDADLYRYADIVIAKPTSQTSDLAVYPISNKVIYNFAKTKVTGKDWLDFVRSYKGTGEVYRGESNAELAEKFISTITVDHYKKNLEQYNTDFRYQLQEFKEGNVLFEIMERNVWGSATADNEGLVKFYTDNKTKYLWSSSANLILFNATNKTVADAARTALMEGKDWKKIIEEGNNNIQADSGRFELSQVPIRIDGKFKAGSVTEPVINPQDGTVSFAKVIKYYDANLQRSFEEAKGLVINDFQNILEEKWISELRKKYPVKINEAVFQSLLK